MKVKIKLDYVKHIISVKLLLGSIAADGFHNLNYADGFHDFSRQLIDFFADEYDEVEIEGEHGIKNFIDHQFITKYYIKQPSAKRKPTATEDAERRRGGKDTY